MQNQNVIFFPWKNSYNTGISEIDAHHQNFLTLLNRIGVYIALDKSEVALLEIIDELLNYATYHLAIEEEIWLSVPLDQEELIYHQQQHQNFTITIQQFKNKPIAPHKKQDCWELFSFLTYWFTAHILESDRRMSFFVSTINEGGTLAEAALQVDQKMNQISHLITSDLLTENSVRLMHEIKSRNQALKKLSHSELRLQQAIKYAKIGYWELPINSNQAYWSPEMFDLFGLSRDASSGPEALCEVMDKDYHNPFYCSVSASFETGAEHHVEYPIVRPSDGERRWIECRGKVVFKEDGKPEKLTGFIQDITTRKENETRIEQLAYYDSLTYLPNRRLLFERLNTKLAGADRSEQSNALLFLDLDNFKILNDIHGHEYGDILLRMTADRITQSIRTGDTASRVGGDEFVVILEGLSQLPIQAAAEVEKIVAKIGDVLTQPYEINEIQYATSCSIGIVLFNDHSLSGSELMKQADIAMYQAKQAGKNTHLFFDPDMQKDIAERVSTEAELERAIVEGEFELYYQPQCNQYDEVLGAEALIRWNHPYKGVISPLQFIPLAEETGLIIPIGEWVISAACAQLKLWQTDKSTCNLSLSVNVSQKQFQQSDFIEKIKGIIAEYGVEANKLKIELTESVLAKDLELTVIRMNELGKMGIKLSLDDFGTGYSSLQYLKTLPLYQLKIDYSFVRDLSIDSNDRAIVKTIISMAKGLGLGVIAEGVETIEQKKYLLSKGCMLYQGFLFSQPLPIDKFEMLLRDKQDIQP